MKAMKVFLIGIILIFFFQCGSLKFENDPPFKILTATYQNGYEVPKTFGDTVVNISYTSTKEISFDSIYFNNKIAKLEVASSNSNKRLICFFKTSNFSSEFVLDENPIKELHNPLPNFQKFPFKLKNNEAIISYKVDEKIKYFRISDLKKE
jgi:hypothetical protein